MLSTYVNIVHILFPKDNKWKMFLVLYTYVCCQFLEPGSVIKYKKTAKNLWVNKVFKECSNFREQIYSLPFRLYHHKHFKPINILAVGILRLSEHFKTDAFWFECHIKKVRCTHLQTINKALAPSCGHKMEVVWILSKMEHYRDVLSKANIRFTRLWKMKLQLIKQG